MCGFGGILGNSTLEPGPKSLAASKKVFGRRRRQSATRSWELPPTPTQGRLREAPSLSRRIPSPGDWRAPINRSSRNAEAGRAAGEQLAGCTLARIKRNGRRRKPLSCRDLGVGQAGRHPACQEPAGKPSPESST